MNKKTLLEDSKIAEEIMQKGSHVSPLAIKVFGGEGKLAGSAFQQQMEHINEAVQNAMKSNLTESFFGVAKKEVMTEAKKPTKPQQTFEVGDKVVVASDALVQHARSVPAQSGYSSHQFSFRDALDKLEKSGAEGTVKKIFDSGRMNVDFGGKVFDLAPNMVSKKEAVKEARFEKPDTSQASYEMTPEKIKAAVLRSVKSNDINTHDAAWVASSIGASEVEIHKALRELIKEKSIEIDDKNDKIVLAKKSMKEGYRGPGEREKPYKIYIDGEFFLKTKHPDSVIDLQIEPEFNVDDVEWKDDEGEIYVTTKPEEDEEKEESVKEDKDSSFIEQMKNLAKDAATARLAGKMPQAVSLDAKIERLYKKAKAAGIDEDDLYDAEEEGRESAKKEEATDLSFYKNLAKKKGLEKIKKEKESHKAKKNIFNYIFKTKTESLVNKMLDRGLVLAESKVNESRKLAYFLSERFIPALEVFVEAKEGGISVKDVKEAIKLQKQGNLSGNQLAKSLDIYADRGEFDGTLESAIECLKQAEYEINEAKEDSEKEEKELSVKEATKVLEKVLGGFKTLLDKVTEKDVQAEIEEYICDIEAILNPEEDEEEGEEKEGDDSEKEEPKEIEESKFKSVKVTYDDGNEITTSVNPNVSDDEIKKYFRVGSSVNFGDTEAHPKDKLVKIKKVEILGVKDMDQND